MLRDTLNVICGFVIGAGVLGGLGWFLWNIFGPAFYGFSWGDAGVLAVILSIIGYAATKRK
jgi:hypothetical protein